MSYTRYLPIYVEAGTAPGEVTLTPAVLTLFGVALGPVPQPVTVALTPAILTLGGVALTPVPGPGSVALSPAILQLAAVPLAATPGPVTVALTPAVLTLAAVPLEPSEAAAPPQVGLDGATAASGHLATHTTATTQGHTTTATGLQG